MLPSSHSPLVSRRRPFSAGFAASTPNLSQFPSGAASTTLAHLASLPPLEPVPHSHHPATTTKSTLVDVVVEGMGGGTDPGQGWQVPPELVTFLRSLGDRLDPLLGPSHSASTSVPMPHTKSLTAALNHATLRPTTDHAGVLALFTELVITERTYLKRIRALNQSYAIPLRQFSKSSTTKIIDKWEATTMFGKIEGLVRASTNLLPVLEKSLGQLQAGQFDFWGGDLATELLNIQRPYRDYLAGYDTVKDAEQKLLKKSEGFKQFCERTKETMYDEGLGRVGLRELLMEPVQRITRYILIFEQILRKMSSSEPSRPGLLEAISTCNRLAICELDDVLIRAATMWGLSRAIEHFPAILVKPGRFLLDALDVLDIIPDGPTATPVPCTLFLFNDTIVIAKKPVKAVNSAGRSLVGLDDLDKLVSAMKKAKGSSSLNSALTGGTDFLAKSLGHHQTPTKLKKGSMRFKGLVDVHDVVVSNQLGPGGPGGEISFDLYFFRPPLDVTPRWSDRPLRHYILPTPPIPPIAAPLPIKTPTTPLALIGQRDKFLGNLRKAQALVKAAEERSTVMRTRFRDQDRGTLENFWNLYDKRTYLSEQRKHRVVLQLVGTDAVERLDFERDLPEPGPPMIVVRACFNEPDDPDCVVSVRVRPGMEAIEEEEVLVKTEALSSLVIRLIDRYKLADIPVPFVSTPTPTHAPSLTAPNSPSSRGGAAGTRTRVGSTTTNEMSRRRFTASSQPLVRARSATSSCSPMAPSATRSPGGPVWYRNLEAMKEETEASSVMMKQSDSNPSLEEEDLELKEEDENGASECSSVSGLSSVLEDEQEEEKEKEQDMPRKMLRGPRQLGIGRVLGVNQERVTSGSSIGKRTERASEDEDEPTRIIQRVDGHVVVDETRLPPTCGRDKKLERSPSSERSRDERKLSSQQRRNVRTKVGHDGGTEQEGVEEVMMKDVDEAEDLFRPLKVKLDKMRNYIKQQKTEGSSSSSSSLASGTIPRSPRKKQLVGLLTETGSGLGKVLEGVEIDVCEAERKVEKMKQSITDLQSALHFSQTELTRTKNELDLMQSSSQVLKELHDALEVENCHLYEAFNEELDKMYHDVQLPPGQAMALIVEDLKRTAEEKGKLVTELGSAKRQLCIEAARANCFEEMLRSAGLLN